MAKGIYEGGNREYAQFSFKEGKFFIGRERAKFNWLSGTVSEIEMVAKEYEGSPYTEAHVHLLDPDDGSEIVLCFNADGYGGGSIIGQLYRAEREHPGEVVRINAWIIHEGDKMPDGKPAEKKRAGCSVRVGGADGERMKPLFAGDREELPEAPQVKVSGKLLRDMEEVQVAIQDTAEALAKLLETAPGVEHSPELEPEAQPEAAAPRQATRTAAKPAAAGGKGKGRAQPGKAATRRAMAAQAPVTVDDDDIPF